ncbi:MAG: mechanosensitive ion channel family protein [Sphaerochaetaceae bacterium]|nr:mechanosensitive ion channel family protein [Sphaerochaetaceae bacterium]
MDSRDFLGTSLVIVVVLVLVVVSRIFFNRSIRKASGKSFPYHRQLVTFTIVLLGVFLAIGLLPIADEVKGQILSVLGILLSAVIALSSTTLVGNAMAGIMLRLMHEFRSGDFIEFDAWVGRVTDFGIFHTEMQLVTRDFVSLPNLMLVQRAVKVTRRGGTFINATVSIGYTVAHQEVEEALCDAATQVGLTDPFVFIEQLLDHAVIYRVFGLLEEFSERLSKTSDLHRAMLDTLHERGIEIASPALSDRRELSSDTPHIPLRVKKETSEKGTETIERLAFDKADEAESLEQLRADVGKLDTSLQEVEESVADKEEKKTAKARIERKKERLQQEIASREKRKKEKQEE